MKTEFIATGNPLVNPRQVINLPPNPYSFLLLKITGKNADEAEITKDDFCRIRITRNGEDLHNWLYGKYHRYTDLKGGHPIEISGAGDEFSFVCQIPFFVSGVPNVLDVQGNNEVDVDLDFNGILTALADPPVEINWQLIGVISESVVESYQLRIFEQNIQSGAAGRVTEEMANPRNVAFYFTDKDAAVNRIDLLRDGIPVANLNDDVLTALSNIVNRVEAAGIGLTEINCAAEGSLRAAIGKNYKFDVDFTGAGILEIGRFQVDFNKNIEIARNRTSKRILNNVNRATKGI